MVDDDDEDEANDEEEDGIMEGGRIGTVVRW